MNSPISWPHAFRAHLSRPSWPVVLLLMAGLHLWLLIWARSLTLPPGTTAAPMQSPQVRWLQAAVVPAPEAEPQVEGTQMKQPRLQATPQPRRPPHPTTAPPEPIIERALPRTPDTMPVPAPQPRNDTPAPEAPAAAAPPQTAEPTANIRPATPAAAPPATAGARTGDNAPTPAHRAAASAPAPSARPIDARQFGCDFPRPPYPRLARLNGESGTTVIHLTLAASGQIATAVVERSSGSAALDAAALASGRAGQCTAGTNARLATVPFHFQLDP